MLHVLSRLVAVVCAVAFVFVTVLVVFFHAGGTRLLRAPVYKDALAKEQFYARFPTLVAESVSTALEIEARRSGGEARGGADAVTAIARQLTPADWQTLLGAVVPPAYLQQQFDGSLDQFFAYLHSETAVLAAKISLVELKRHLTGPEAEAAYLKMLASKPPCASQPFDASAGLPLACQPAAVQMPQVLENFRRIMRLVADQVADEIDPFKGLRRLDGPEGASATLAKARKRIDQVEWLARWSPVAPAALALLIVIFAVRSLRGWLLWWGLPCFVAGVVSAVIAFPSVPVARWVFAHLLVPRLPAEAPAVTLQTLFGVMTTLVQEILSAALTTAGALAIGGLVAMALAHFLKPRAVAG